MQEQSEEQPENKDVDLDAKEAETDERLAKEFAYLYLKKFFKRAEKKDKSVKDLIAEESGSEPIRYASVSQT